MRRFAAVFAIASLAACADNPSSTSPVPMEGDPAVRSAAGQAGRFIVQLRDDADGASVAREHGVTPDYVYSSAIHGFAGSMSDAAREGLLRDARVVRVEPDQQMEAYGTQTGATWGLDRIDQRALPLSTTYTYNSNGAGATVYIIDTGIRFDHTEFGGRATPGYDAVTANGSAADCNGHGTHVAGTVGGATYGVAKGVALVAVRVLDCAGNGTTSGVIAGIDWVTSHHAANAVANMSLGGGLSSTLNSAVANSIAAGVTYAVAAGNGNQGGVGQDACKYSPASVATAITVGATDKTDTKPTFSNFGNCVDLFAPGVGITSAWYTGSGATNTISGTSMATPHVAGVAALYVALNPGATPAQVSSALYNLTTKNVVKGSKTTNAHLLFTNF